MALIFAQKLNYEIDANQELLAQVPMKIFLVIIYEFDVVIIQPKTLKSKQYLFNLI